jgi:hypothetical protein
LRFAEELPKVERHFRLVIHFDANFAEPYSNLAYVLQQDDRHDEMIEVCQKGLNAKKAKRLYFLKTWRMVGS